MIDDFTKLESPFVRKIYEVDRKDFKQHGSRLGLRTPEVYLVTPEVAAGYDWVVQHPDTTAVEKLHGCNMGIKIEGKRLVHVQNRQNVVDMFEVMGGRGHQIEGIFAAIHRQDFKDYLGEGVHYGECLGPKLNGNLYRLPGHLWYPFAKARDSLKYASFHRHEKGFWPWVDWFRLYLRSLLYCRLNKIPFSAMFTDPAIPFAEGVVFYNDTISTCGKPRMAKLRRDMMPWHYWDDLHIVGLEDHWIQYGADKNLKIKGYR